LPIGQANKAIASPPLTIANTMDRYTSYHDINHQVMDSSWYDAQPTISPTLDDNAKKTKSSRRGGGKPRTGIAVSSSGGLIWTLSLTHPVRTLSEEKDSLYWE